MYDMFDCVPYFSYNRTNVITFWLTLVVYGSRQEVQVVLMELSVNKESYF